MVRVRRAFIRQPRREQWEEGRRGGGRRGGGGGRQRCGGVNRVRAHLPTPCPPPPPCIGSHCASAAEQGTSEREGGGGSIGREFTGRDLCLESGRTYLRTEVLNCPSWGPAPRRWLWVQTWPSLLWYRRCNSAANRAGSGLVGSPAQA